VGSRFAAADLSGSACLDNAAFQNKLRVRYSG